VARERKRLPQAPTGFVASAARLPNASRKEIGSEQAWQKTAWEFYNTVPELRYVANWIGNVMSRAEWHAAKRVGDNLEVVTEGPAFDAMEALYGGRQGQQEMTQLLGTDMTIGGEGYLTARRDEWAVLATGKVTTKRGGRADTGKAKLSADWGEGPEDVKPSDLIIRVWSPHPMDAKIADAPTRSNLRTMAQIVAYDDHIAAQLTSRLAGAGVWMVPSEIDFAPDPEADPEATQADGLMMKLHEAMEAAKEDRTSPAAFVPIVVTIPGELIQYAKHQTFWSDLDDAVIEMRDAAIRRFGIGMDVPPEVLLGNAESNHWNAWLSEESAIKAHLEPRLSVIGAALSAQYLRPSLIGTPLEKEAEDYYVIADTAPIRTRPNRATEAMQLRDKGLLKADVVLAETGFHPNDAMEDAERVRWLMERVALGAVTPEITAEALRFLGAPIVASGTTPQNQPDQTREDTVVPDDERQTPDQAEREARNKADEERALAAAAEVLVFRALERAGNKLKNSHNGDSTKMAADAVYMTYTGEHDHLLEGAWDCAPKVLEQYSVDVDEVVDTLDFYVRGLLSQKKQHNRKTMVRLLRSAEIEVW
jgi:hypothetical protein